MDLYREKIISEYELLKKDVEVDLWRENGRIPSINEINVRINEMKFGIL